MEKQKHRTLIVKRNEEKRTSTDYKEETIIYVYKKK